MMIIENNKEPLPQNYESKVINTKNLNNTTSNSNYIIDNNNINYNNNNNSSNNNIDNSNLDYEINSSNNSANNNDQCDMTSLEILNKCHLDLFPKKTPTSDDDSSLKFVSKLPTLSGEYIQFIGSLNDQKNIFTWACPHSIKHNICAIKVQRYTIRK